MTDPNTAALVVVAHKLAVTLSELAKKISRSPDEVRRLMKPLAERRWVKAKEIGKGGEVIYSITARGARELENGAPKGVVVRQIN